MAMTALLKELIGGRKSRKVHHSSKTHFKKHRKTRRNKNTRKKHAGFLEDFFNNATKAMGSATRAATEAVGTAKQEATKAVGDARNAVIGSVPPPKKLPPSRVDYPHVDKAIKNAKIPPSQVAVVGGKKTRRKRRKNRRK